MSRLPEPFPLPYRCRVQWARSAEPRRPIRQDRRSCAGGRSAGATCRGGPPATRGRCSSARSWPSRPRWPGVAERWAPFLERFPTPAACAEAPVAEVLRLVERARLQPPGPRPAPVRRGGGRAPRRPAPVGPRRAAGPARASARTRRGRSPPSPSSTTTAWSTPTRRGCWPGGTAALAVGPRGPGGGRRGRPAGRGLGVEPGHARPGRHGLQRGATPRLRGLPRHRLAAAGGPPGGPSPTRPTARPACRRGQSRFDGSDRQGRGRLVEALRSAPVDAVQLAAAMGWPDDPARAERVAATLVADGLVEQTAGGPPAPRERVGAQAVTKSTISALTTSGARRGGSGRRRRRPPSASPRR